MKNTLHPGTCLLALALCGPLVLSVGCMDGGGLWAKTIKPYSTDFHNTPVGSKHCVLSEYEFREPISGYGVSADVNFSAVRLAAQNAGITNIYYVDLDTLSIAGGTYLRKRLVVYGD